MDGSPPGSPVPRILQARIAEWVAISFSNACMHATSVVSDSVWPYGQQPTRLLCPQDSLGKNTGMGCHFLLQRRQLATSITNLAQEVLMNIHCSSGSRSFAKEPRALKTRSVVIGHWKLTTMNWEPSLKLILLQLLEKLLKKSVSTILQ